MFITVSNGTIKKPQCMHARDIVPNNTAMYIYLPVQIKALSCFNENACNVDYHFFLLNILQISHVVFRMAA